MTDEKTDNIQDSIKSWTSYFYNKMWAWMVCGMIGVYVLLQITQWLIVVIGGSYLGLYLYKIWGPDRDKKIGGGRTKKAWSFFKGSVDKVLRAKEGFDNYELRRRSDDWNDKDSWTVGDLFWKATH